MKCMFCNNYLRKNSTEYNTYICSNCKNESAENYDILDEELNLELELLINPSGKVQACITEDDSHGL